jgi:hypothetical protein
MADLKLKTDSETLRDVNLFLKSLSEISFWVGSYPIFATSFKKTSRYRELKPVSL